MSKAIAILDRLIGWIAAAALAITFVLLVYNVATRYLISFGWLSPSVQLNWVFEICVFLLVWAVLLGVARIEKRAQHIRVDFLYNLFGPKGQMATEILALIFGMLYAALPVAFAVHLLFIIERFRLLVTTGESAKHAHVD